jgi:two-component system, OmpR family, sensor histidine kinase KdpD
MAAGVGKTFRMLQEGRIEAEEGRDVVVGYLEPHGRPETEAEAIGLELVPRRTLTHRELSLEEMDLPHLLDRDPELCLVDELAHTNAPGAEHAKRYEDIQDLLAAGIDVFSTVNVQHLESLNDSVAELTGTHVRETFPDSVLASADQVVLIDVTPEMLVERLRAGKVYPRDRVDTALGGFFKIENLQALRETALRQVAESVEQRRIVRESVGTRRDLRATAGQAVGERLLALVTPRPSSQRLVRRAWRSAQRLGSELDLLWVARPDRNPSEEEERRLTALRRLASTLGANLIIEEGDDVAEVVGRVATDRGITYILLGRPERPRGLGRLAEPLPQRLMRALPWVDIRIVADRARKPVEEER